MPRLLKHFAAGLAAVALASACSSPEVDPALQSKLEAAAPDAVQPLIDEEAKRLGVTALTYSVLEGDKEPVNAYFGNAKAGGLMQVASLSKTVAAAVILILADQRGVGLDEDIRPQIASLDIAALEGGDRPVTLRQLLSHTTGASQHGYAGYPRESALPSTADIIANPPRTFESALAFDGEPGAFRYSGGGYMIAQLWAQDVSGKPFDALANELLIDPLGLTQSTFTQPIDPQAVAPLTIVGADASLDIMDGVFSGIENSWHDYPEQAAAGFWTTADDYARFVAAFMDAAAGAETAIPQSVAAEMITPQIELGPTNAYGLGTMLVLKEDGSVRYVTHSGANTGYRALYSARPQTGDLPRRVVVSIGNTVPSAGLNEAIVFALTDPD